MTADDFILNLPAGGFLDTPEELAELTRLERYCPVYFRLYEARFTCWVQYAQTMLDACRKADLSLRDICVTADRLDLAKARRAELERVNRKRILSDSVMFNEAECGGAFDGRQVTSDADPGL